VLGALEAPQQLLFEYENLYVFTHYISETLHPDPPFRTPGIKVSVLRMFTFGLGGPSLSLPNFSLLPHEGVGETSIFTFIGSVIILQYWFQNRV
jgi:hypothetical protein